MSQITDIGEGIGMTTEQAAQLKAIYDQVIIDKHIGDVVTASVTGSHTNASYKFTICYISSTLVCLLGNTNFGNATWATACSYRWNVSIAAGQLTNSAITLTGVSIPSHEQIYNRCAGYKRDFHYWTRTALDSSYSWNVRSSGSVPADGVSNSLGSVPFAEINL